MRLITDEQLQRMRNPKPVEWQINPVPFLFMGGLASWAMIGLAAYVFMR